jgi:hypothetical protein
MANNKDKICPKKRITDEAVENIRNGRYTVNEASRFYNIPYTTLYNRVSYGNKAKNPVGRPTILTSQQESENIGVPFRKKDLTELVTDFVKTEEIKNN